MGERVRAVYSNAMDAVVMRNYTYLLYTVVHIIQYLHRCCSQSCADIIFTVFPILFNSGCHIDVQMLQLWECCRQESSLQTSLEVVGVVSNSGVVCNNKVVHGSGAVLRNIPICNSVAALYNCTQYIQEFKITYNCIQ